MEIAIAFVGLLCACLAVGWLSYRLRFKELLDELKVQVTEEAVLKSEKAE